MIQIPSLISIIPLFLGVLAFLFVMLLPTIIELKRPKDAGPRIILEEAFNLHFLGFSEIPSLDDDEEKLDPKVFDGLSKVLSSISLLEV